MPLSPSIDESVHLDTVVDLAIFADVHEVELLHNHSIDILREELGNSNWTVTPYIVGRVYTNLGDGAKLRTLVGDLLWHAGQDTSKSDEQTTAAHDMVDKWCETFSLTADMGRDYYLSSCAQRAIKQIKEDGPCRYHWRKDIDEETLPPFQRDQFS
ncbi:hypothetical protein LTR51_008656 [Lithohypha guttulata]|nr:hypothetical protein LTR51_008656 [Lithohypha guttulata]